MFALAQGSELGEDAGGGGAGGGGEPALEEASSDPTSFPSLRRCHLLQVWYLLLYLLKNYIIYCFKYHTCKR